MDYMNVAHDDLVANGVLTKDELEWASNIRIPYLATGGQWFEKYRIDSIVAKAIEDGKVAPIKRAEFTPQKGGHIISDYMDGPGGALLNHADGKMYDSKSQYYRAVKAAGCEVLGNDAPRELKEREYKVDDNDIKRDIYNAIQQHGG